MWHCLPWGIANINDYNQALEMFRGKVLLQSSISGEICFQLQRVCEQAQPPDTELCTGHILPLCSPRPILIIQHGQLV